MCIGRNYADHIKELSSATPKQPFFFLKPPSSILLPGAGPVLRPKGVTMHYEVELGLIMGKTLRDLHPDDTKGAMDAIEGMITFLPITLRAFRCAPHIVQSP
jgi:acylpyruvate hydrolase